MVNNIPVKFKRTAAAFDEVAVRVRSCESSGSEHSGVDLSDLVNSFLERQISSDEINNQDIDEVEIDDELEIANTSPDFELQDSLKDLFDLKNDAVKRSIHAEVEKALREDVGDNNCKRSSPEFNRRLMACLRNRGFDAGLCKSKWEKNGRNPSGNYEYIDVNANGNRYIIEVFLAGEFTIARPTVCYASLLDVFPQVFVGKPDELKQVARLMCSAIRKSMKRVDLNVPPWRRLAYMHAKWFDSYKRTTNEIPSSKVSSTGRRNMTGENRFLGFAPVDRPVSLYCRQDFAGKAAIGGRIGNLTAAFNQKEMLL